MGSETPPSDPSSGFLPSSTSRPRAIHVPVLLREVIAQLDLQPGLVVVDGTIGAGGHSREILSRIQPGGRLIGLDRDPMMLEFARTALPSPDVTLVHSSYRDLRSVLDSMQLPAADRVLLDLGLSSDQLADRTRGFGFDAGGTLDMRFDTSRGQSAADWLATVSPDELARVLSDYGEVKAAHQVAAAIIRRCATHPIRTAEDLSETIASTGGRNSRDRSQAAPIFQAIRIAVNDELRQLQEFMDDGLPGCVAPGGRAAIISFHSLEDRIVKQAFRGDGWEALTLKPIEATPAEARINPRSRSARLRVALRKQEVSRS